MSDNTNIRVRILKANRASYWYSNRIGQEYEVKMSEKSYHTTQPGIFAHKYEVQSGHKSGSAIDLDDATIIGDIKKIVFNKPIVLFSLVSAEGLFFKSGSFEHIRWTDDINEAKVYGKVGPARSWATKFAKEFPDKIVPRILEISASTGMVVDETERVAKAINGIKKASANRDEQNAKYRLEAAKREFERAKKNLNDHI